MEKNMRDSRRNFQLGVWFAILTALMTALSRLH
jgi:hypothetical protein